MYTIRWQESGGFVGPAHPQVREFVLSEQAAPEEMPLAAQLRQVLAGLDFFHLPADLRKAAPKSWDFEQSIEVVQSAGGIEIARHLVRFHLDDGNGRIQQLARLAQLLKSAPMPG